MTDPQCAEPSASNSEERWARIDSRLVLVFLLALALRVGLVVALPDREMFPDSLKYRAIAQNILARRGFGESPARQASRAPGYPLLLAAVPGGATGTVVWVRLVQSLMGAVTAVLVCLLGKRLFNRRVGLVAGAIAAIYPMHVFLSGLVLSETFFMLLMAWAVLGLAAIARPRDETAERPRRHLWYALGVGVVIGLATMARSSFLLFAPFFLPFLLAGSRRRAWALARWGMVAVGLCLVLAPWVWRNYRIYHRVVLTTLQVGESLYEANSPMADGGPMLDEVDRVAAEHGLTGDEYQRDQWFRREALQYMVHHPGREAQLAGIKLLRFWNPIPNHVPFRHGLIIVIGLLSYVPVMALAMYGMWAARRRWRELLVVLAPIIYYTCLHMVFVGSIRYRAPIMLFIFVPAAYGFCRFWGRKAIREAA